MALAENLEVLNLRAIAGQYDLQERHTGLAKLPVFLENRAKGNYDVQLDPALNGSRRHAADQPGLRGRPRDRQVAAHPGLPPRARRWASTAISSTRRSGSASAPPAPSPRPRRCPTARARSGARSGPRYDVEAGQRAPGQDRPRQEGRRGLPPADGRQGAAPHRAADLGGRLHAAHPDRRDDQGAVEEDRHPGGREGDGARPLLHPHREQRAPDRHLGRTTAPRCSTSSRATPCRWIRWRRCWVTPSPAGTPATASQGKAPKDPQMLKALELFRSAAGKKTPGALQDRPGDLEDPGGRAVQHRHGRAVAGHHGRADREQEAGQHPGAPDQRAARADPVLARTRPRSSSRRNRKHVPA